MENDLKNEVWNKSEYIEGEVDDEKLGIDMVKLFNRRLSEKCTDLKAKAADRTYTGQGLFKDY